MLVLFLVKKDLNNWLKNLKKIIVEFNHSFFVEHPDELILLVIFYWDVFIQQKLRNPVDTIDIICSACINHD